MLSPYWISFYGEQEPFAAWRNWENHIQNTNQVCLTEYWLKPDGKMWLWTNYNFQSATTTKTKGGQKTMRSLIHTQQLTALNWNALHEYTHRKRQKIPWKRLWVCSIWEFKKQKNKTQHKAVCIYSKQNLVMNCVHFCTSEECNNETRTKAN